jgi:hypothetical protein
MSLCELFQGMLRALREARFAGMKCQLAAEAAEARAELVHDRRGEHFELAKGTRREDAENGLFRGAQASSLLCRDTTVLAVRRGEPAFANQFVQGGTQRIATYLQLRGKLALVR